MRTAACALAALCLLAIASSASALILPGNRTLPDRELIPLACQYVEDGWTVCHPYSQSRYITCGRNARARTCSTGMLYDYGVRRCLPRAYARPCRPHRCPLARSWTPTNVTRFGIQPMLANYTNRSDLSETILLDKVGVTTYFCPSAAHCQHGMITNVVVLANPPRGRPPQHFRVEWIELLRTDDLYPKFIDDIVGYVGDTVEFHWDVPLHNLAAYDPTAPDAAPYIPYIPQPRFHCPFWTFDFSNSSTENLVQVDMLPRGEVRYVNETFQAFGATGPMDFGPGSGFNLTITESMHRKYIVCPHPSHCRMGMVFQLFVQPAPAGYRPRLHTLEWVVIEYWNYPDMTVTAGDIINFYTPAPFIANNDFDFTAIQVYAMSVLDEDLITRLYF